MQRQPDRLSEAAHAAPVRDFGRLTRLRRFGKLKVVARQKATIQPVRNTGSQGKTNGLAGLKGFAPFTTGRHD
jgi:hypothetical protein